MIQQIHVEHPLALKEERIRPHLMVGAGMNCLGLIGKGSEVDLIIANDDTING
jgi:hypothetical protein